MAAHVDWNAPDKTSLLIEFHTSLTWDEFDNAIKQAHQMIETVSHQVGILIWVKIELPPGNALHHFLTASKKQPTNTGRLVVVMPAGRTQAMASFMNRLAQIVARLFPRKGMVMFAASYEEGQDLLRAKAQPDPPPQ
jgi:hypothetical protein